MNIVAAILKQYLAARPCFHDVTPSERWLPKTCEEAFNYHSWLWLLLSHIIFRQTCSKLRNDSIEDSEVETRLEKNGFC